MNRKLTIVLLLTVVALMGVPGTLALSAYKDDFNAKYNTTGTRIDQCILCHVNPGGGFPLNSYGMDLDNQLKNLTSTPSNANQSTVNQSLTNIEPLDSDGDGFINIDEIHNLTFPGNASDFSPKITSFAPPSPVVSSGTPATVTFSVTINQVVDNATWALDGTVTKTEHNVNASNDTLTTNTVGMHIVTFTAQRTGDGSAMQNWTWNVSAPTTLKSIIVSPSTANLTVNGTQVFTATALGQNNTPMAGVNISWTSSNTTVGTVSPSSATTNMNGTATTTFTAKAAGTAMVNATSGNVSGSANVNVINVTAVQTFNISGFKINASSGSEIPGWNITIKNTTMQKSVLTGADGSYKFTGLVNGTYNVSEEMKPGFTPVGATFRVITIENMDVTNVNFTNEPIPPKTFNISGFKINDTNGNGVWNPGEMGIENWNINLLNAAGTLIDRTSTNATGFYEFMDVAPGNYNVTEETKPGFTPTNATFRVITIENMDVMNVNFTNMPSVLQANGSISGTKFNDSDGNGIRESNETGLPNWTIDLNYTNGTIFRTTMTDTNGNYSFTNVPPGTYVVQEILKPGWTQTAPSTGTYSVTITTAGENITGKDFGNMLVVRPVVGSISGFKINAANGMGLQGWTIRLIGIVDKGTGTRVIRMDTTTNADGSYMFNDLPAGRYILREKLQRGFVPVGPPVKHIMLAQGENFMNNNFTNRPIRSLDGIEDHKDIEDLKDTEDNKDTEDDLGTE